MSDNGNVLLRVENLVKYFPIMRSVRSFRTRRVPCALWMISPFMLIKAKPWAWWVNPAVESPPPGARILQLYRPTSGQSIFDGDDLVTLKGEDLRKIAARCR